MRSVAKNSAELSTVRRRGVAFLLWAFICFYSATEHSGLGQSSAQTFEAASIKLNRSADYFSNQVCQGVDTRIPPTAVTIPGLGRCKVIRMGLKNIISFAYSRNLNPGQVDKLITGGPAWISSNRFDIDAKAEDSSVTEAQLRLMLQALLVERFKLQVHQERREASGFALVVAKGGPKLTESKPESRPSSGGRVGQVTAQNVTLSDSLLRFLNTGTALDGPVIDRTGLHGKYDFTLKWAADSVSPNTAEPSGPSVFTAVQEQLGLRLEGIKTTVEVWVIDRVELPSAN